MCLYYNLLIVCVFPGERGAGGVYTVGEVVPVAGGGSFSVTGGCRANRIKRETKRRWRAFIFLFPSPNFFRSVAPSVSSPCPDCGAKKVNGTPPKFFPTPILSNFPPTPLAAASFCGHAVDSSN